MTLDLKKELRRYGAAADAVKLLDAKDDEGLLRYVDLFPESIARKGLKGTATPDAVLEHEDRPLIYVYRADSLATEPADLDRHAAEAIRGLACRDEGSYLAVIRPGELVIYPVGLLKQHPRPSTFKASPESALLIHDLASGNVPTSLKQQAATAQSLHELLYELITKVARELRTSNALSVTRECDEVLPLVGRAVFTRFLIDRGIINERTFAALWKDGVKPERAFSTPKLAARTCAWLDDKFNGELLPLLAGNSHPTYDDYLAFFNRDPVIGAVVLHQLTNVMYRAPDGRLSLALSWDGVDFAHVPIGLLSEVYEDYAHEFYENDALRESVRYTPRHIAELTVAHAFEGLASGERHSAKVLDPACGAGIFLVLTLQRLVAETWRQTKVRPDTNEIRRILNEQVRGYDINHSAMTLAALSLYLAALELDPDPFPPEKLRFDRLLGSVLHNMRGPGEAYPYAGVVLGSLGEQGDPVPKEKLFDIFTGNPPWTSFDKWGTKKNAFSAYVKGMIQRILPKHRQLDARLQDAIASYQHADNVPDVAFLWRAIEWTRPDGVIAFIVAGRLLFKRGGPGAHMRNTLFQFLQITGVLNGALLMPLWKKINQPFCIVFARNRAPKPDGRFTMVTPVLETSPTREMRMRIDAEARQPVSIPAALERPHVFKALTRGGRLDIDIVERIQEMLLPPPPFEEGKGPTESRAVTIGEVWQAEWTQGLKRSGQGYKPGLPTSKEIRRKTAELLRREALSLTSDDLLDDFGALKIGLRIAPSKLAPFKTQVIHRMTDVDICESPLVLIKEGFGESADNIRARLYIGTAPLAFRRNFYGFSCAGHPHGKRLAKLIFSIVNSELFGYYTLMTSAKFGLERRTLLIEDIEDFPILRTLSDAQWKEVEEIADALKVADPESWKRMNRCINRLYGLTRSDEQVMSDTLATMMPYKAAQTRARAPAKKAEIEAFRAKVESTAQPLFSPDGQQVVVSMLKMPMNGWVAFELKVGATASAKETDLVTEIASQLADQEGLSRVIQPVAPGVLRVAICNQYRYLTLSRARLCAIDVMREYGHLFPMPGTE